MRQIAKHIRDRDHRIPNFFYIIGVGDGMVNFVRH